VRGWAALERARAVAAPKVSTFTSYCRANPKTSTFMSYSRAGQNLSNFIIPLRSFDKSLFLRSYNRPSWKRSVVDTLENESSAGISRKNFLLYGAAGVVAGAMLFGVFADGGRTRQDAGSYTSIEKARIHATYSYLLGGLATTAAISTVMFRTGYAARLLALNPWVALGGSLLLTVGSMIGTQAISYHNTIPKHAMWLVFNACVAASLAPIGYLGGPLVLKAALVTGCVVGGLSVAGAAAPSETWLKMRGPLSIGLGVVVGASLGQMFFPASSLLYNVALYGGLAVFGGFVLFDTARIRRAAQSSYDYDPVNASLGIYLNTINIFVRVAQLMAGGGSKRK